MDEAENQIQAGSHILDVNVDFRGSTKRKNARSCGSFAKNYATPLQLDSSEPEVLEYALRYYNGKPLVNSVNGKQKYGRRFSTCKKYGALVVALCLDEDGIPSTVEGRLSIAKKSMQKRKNTVSEQRIFYSIA